MSKYDAYEYFDKGEICVWMPMIGFDKEEPDKGVSKLLERMQFKPHAMSVFLFHPDIVHHYAGLDTEYHLHPDNCAYYASPRNEERNRQDWTNQDLKVLVDNLNDAKIDSFLGIMGVDISDKYHHEWISDHPEIRQRFRKQKWSLNVLKRFADGTWYEDYFIDKLCTVMQDYGFTGLHVADNFCPGGGGVYTNDYSVDMTQQFVAHTGYVFPAEIAELGDDDDSVTKRADWIWENARQEWIEFYGWRWAAFWKKVCDRLHAIGKKAFVLGMYCTDPFQTLYHKGVDLRKLQEAGVDYFMPNMAASGSSMCHNRAWRYYEQATMMPLSDVFADKTRKLNMLGVKDGTEEWDMLHHAPTMLERDIYYLLSYFRYTPDGLKRCLDGFNVCLGDGIYADEWKWLKDRFDVAFGEIPEKVLLPTVVWSDNAFYNTLPDFIQTRRWTLHKFMVELAKSGTQTGAMVRMEHLSEKCGDIFVPNFDLLSEEEKKQIATYRGGAVICTASAEKGFGPEQYGIEPEIYFEDQHSPYKNCAFAFNLTIRNKAAILACLYEDDGSLALDDPFHAQEVPSPSFREDMVFQKVSVGFVKALGMLLKESLAELVEATMPILPMQMADGRLRIYSINDDRLHYGKNLITVHRPIQRVENISRFPMLPVKFTQGDGIGVTATTDPTGLDTFRVPTPQGGISIVDVYFND